MFNVQTLNLNVQCKFFNVQCTIRNILINLLTVTRFICKMPVSRECTLKSRHGMNEKIAQMLFGHYKLIQHASTPKNKYQQHNSIHLLL